MKKMIQLREERADHRKLLEQLLGTFVLTKIESFW